MGGGSRELTWQLWLTWRQGRDRTPFVYMQGSKYSKWGINCGGALNVAALCAHWQAAVVHLSSHPHFWLKLHLY